MSPYRPRWPLLLTLIGGVAVLITLAYLPSAPAGDELPTAGGSYVEGVVGNPSRINPLFATSNAVDQDLTSLIFSGLVRLGPKGDVQPDLAEKPSLSPDGLTYIFRLHPNLFWHDGEPLDADDVLFTIAAIQDPDFRGDPVLAELFQGVTVEALDERTIVMTRPQPFAPFLARGATVGILPEHLLRDLSATALFDSRFNQQPIGSGPYRLFELTPTAATLEAFDSYHFGRPLIETLELRFFKESTVLLNSLLNEKIDGTLFRSGLGSDDLALIDDDSRWVRRSLHTSAYSLVYVNPNVPPFEDSAVRRALQHALDREKIIEDLLDGQALLIDSPISRDLWAHVSNGDAYAYDPALAASLLDEAGWLLENGVRTKEETPLQFRLATSDDPTQSRVAREIAEQWRQFGIEVEVQVSSVTSFTEEILLPRNFDAALRVISPPGADPDPYPFWHSSQISDQGLNLANFSHREADLLLENARLATSAAERANDYRAFQEIFARELPALLLYTATFQYVVRADVGNVKPGLLFTTSSRFQDVHGWYVETEVLGDDSE